MVEELKVRVSADTADLTTGLARANTAVAAFGTEAVTSMDGAARATDRMEAATQRVGGSLRNTTKAIRIAGQSSRMFAMHLSQAAQQGAVTGNYLQALAYQLPDLGLRFGVLGIGIAAVAGVILPALVGAMQATSAKAKAMETAFETLTEKTEAFKVSAAAIRLGVDEEEVALVQRLNSVLQERVILEEQLRAIEASSPGLGVMDQLEPLDAELKLIREQIAAYRAAREEAEKLTATHGQDYKNIAAMTAKFEEGVAAKAREEEFTARILGIVTQTKAVVADIVAAGSRMSGVFAAAQGAAAGLAATLQSAAAAAWSIAEGRAAAQAAGPDERGSQRKQVHSAAGFVRDNPVMGGGGGSSGGGSGGGASALEMLMEELRTEAEVLAEWYAESQATLDAALAAKQLSEEGYREQRERLEAEHQERMKRIRDMGSEAGISSVLKGGEGILSAMGAFSKKSLAMAKVFAAADALVSTYQGAAAELKKGTFGFASAAAVIAKGLAFVAAIRGVNASGGGGGGGGSASSVAAAQPAALPVQRVLIDYQGPASAMPSFSALVDMLNQAGRNGHILNAQIVGRP